MKREILCVWCRPNVRELFPTDNPYPGEHVKFVDGTAKMDRICDQCGCPIEAGQTCTAFSSWADYGGIPYFPWESGYLELA